MGLSEDLARALTYHTAAGAAALAQQSQDDIATLRHKVTSPGGTTEQAILTFEEGGLRDLIAKALDAARTRSVELAEETDSKYYLAERIKHLCIGFEQFYKFGIWVLWKARQH